MNLTDKCKAALLAAFKGTTDEKGYTSTPEENLLPGIRMDQFEEDFRQGDGNELEKKSRAVHSSSILAVNSFAWFKDERKKDEPKRLILYGHRDFKSICFELKLETGFPRKPNIDVWLESLGIGIGIESKLLEYIAPKVHQFKEKYQPEKLPWVEDCWWKVWDEGKKAAQRQHLDVAQLAKHYFGLSRLLRKEKSIKSATLFYLFWEPENESDFPEFKDHRDEVKTLSDAVKGSEIPFEWGPYKMLWDQWEKENVFPSHVENLRKRYCVRVS